MDKKLLGVRVVVAGLRALTAASLVLVSPPAATASAGPAANPAPARGWQRRM